MSKSVCCRSIAIVLALLLPLIMIGLQNIATQPAVWIVYADSQDSSTELASQIFKQEVACTPVIIRETLMDIE